MSIRRVVVTLAGIAIVAGASIAAYRAGMDRGMAMTAPAPAADATPAAASTADPSAWSIPQGEEATRRHIRDGLKAGDVDPSTGRRVLHYHDPMVPGNRFDRPAKSPFMNMMLVPVYAGTEGADTSQVTVSPRIQQNLGVRTAEVVSGVLAPEISAVGAIAWNERDQAVVQARAAGFVERLHVRAALDPVQAGQPLVELYVPDWVAAQEEFLALARMRGDDLARLREGDLAPLVDAARARMRQAGMDAAQIARVEDTGRMQARVTVRAPLGGVATEVAVREGMTVSPGTTLVRINGTSTVWAHAEVPESQIALVRPGASVRATTPAAPGRTFEGRVQALLPQVDAATRTMRARVQLDNRDGGLVPGMFVTMRFEDARLDKVLLAPTEAVIHTGRRNVVLLAEEGGRFRPVEVETGIESGGRIEIRRGLEAGQRIVVSSQFLIDSEASLKGVEARLNATPAPADAALHRTDARVEAVDGDTVTLTHPPIASLKWPEMTMDFKLPPRERLPRGLAAGDAVAIEFRMQEGDVPQITSVQRVAPPAPGGRP